MENSLLLERRKGYYFRELVNVSNDYGKYS